MSRRGWRLARGAGLVALVAAAIYLVPTLWLRPWQIDAYYARVFLQFALRHPMMLSSLGILNGTPISYHEDDLDDFSPEARRRDARFGERQLEILRGYDVASMRSDRRLSARVMDWFLDDQHRANRFMFHDYPLNQLRGFHSELVDFIISTQPLRRAQDARNYVKRVRKFGVAVDQMLAGLDLRERDGIVPPRWVLDKVLDQLHEFAALEPGRNPLVTHFEEKAAAGIPGLSKAERERLRAELEAALREVVLPAWARMEAAARRQRASASADDGVWRLPDGDAFYDQCLRSRTTTETPADSIHALGQREVARIHGQMREILERQGYRAPDVGRTVKRVRDEARFRFGDGDPAREEILAEYRAILAEAAGRVPALFDVMPGATLEVRRVPEFREKGSAGAYYMRPALDGSRPGVFYANLRDPTETARPDMRTLAYHEGIPGHHFQIGIQQEIRGVPFFRKVIPFTAYSEGWALYAERLALEEGFHPTAFDSLGALQAELFRAARLVVDTGIHRKRWTRRQATGWMIAATGMDSSEVATEIERYIVNPGQACAYKVGQLEILALRERARSALGPRFDIRRFHNVVLTNGALPLTLLRQVVDEWIASERRSAAAAAAG